MANAIHSSAPTVSDLTEGTLAVKAALDPQAEKAAAICRELLGDRPSLTYVAAENAGGIIMLTKEDWGTFHLIMHAIQPGVGNTKVDLTMGVELSQSGSIIPRGEPGANLHVAIVRPTPTEWSPNMTCYDYLPPLYHHCAPREDVSIQTVVNILERLRDADRKDYGTLNPAAKHA